MISLVALLTGAAAPFLWVKGGFGDSGRGELTALRQAVFPKRR